MSRPVEKRAEIKEAADRLGVHPNTVRSWLDRGELKGLDPADVATLRERIQAPSGAIVRVSARR